MDEALQNKIDSILEQENTKEIDKSQPRKIDKKQQENDNNATENKTNKIKKADKPILEKTREAHEHYQLVLSEYHRKLKQRKRKIPVNGTMGQCDGRCECLWTPKKKLDFRNMAKTIQANNVLTNVLNIHTLKEVTKDGPAG